MNLEDLLKEHNIEYRHQGEHHHATRNWLQIDCIYCSRNSFRFRMGLNKNFPTASCYVCGVHPFQETLRELLDAPNLDMRGLFNFDLGYEEYTPIRGKLTLPDGISALQKPHTKYLESRGLDPEEMKTLWNLQGISHSKTHPWRIFIPISYQGKIASWTTRSLKDIKKKYKNATPSQERIHYKHLLFGEEYCRYSICICEGPFDAMKIGPGSVCTFGVKVSKEQLAKMSKYLFRVVCFDNENDAQRRAQTLCESLALFPGETKRVVLKAKDPGSANNREVKALRGMLK